MSLVNDVIDEADRNLHVDEKFAEHFEGKL
jgi:hypothetical protein